MAATVSDTGTVLTIEKVSSEKTYVVGVRGTNTAGSGAWTNSAAVSAGGGALAGEAPVELGNPTLAVGSDGAASWSYTMPQGPKYAYTELRWVPTEGRDAGNWSGTKVEVFYDGAVNKHTITGLSAGTEYKARVTYALTEDGEFRFAKSDTVTFTTPPAAVASVTASRESGGIVASWDAVTGATGYDVRYSSDDGATWTQAATNRTETTYTLAEADYVLAYVIGVRAVNAGGESAWTNSATVPAVPPLDQAPGKVTNLSATRQNGGIVATWDAVTGDTKYHVTYSTDGGASWSLAAGEHATNSITIANADGKLPYVVGVRAGNAAGWSGWVNSNKVPAVSSNDQGASTQ